MTAVSRTEPITVLHLIAPAHFGGAEGVVLNLADAIDRSRFNVVVGSFVNARFPDNEFLGRVREMGIRSTVFWLRRTVDVGNIPRLVRFIRSEGVAIVHTHGYRSDIVGLIAARLSSRPVIATIHGFVPIDPRLRVYEQCDRFALRFFDRVLPVSDQIGRALFASGVRRERMTTIRNAIAPGGGAGPKRSVSPLPLLKRDGDFLIGIVGRLSPEKNIPGFLEAARRLSGRYGHLRFVVVGEGPERECLEGLTMKLGLDGKVRFTGFVEEMEEVYSLLDMLVIASSTEGIPLTVLEAMRHGIPVVSTGVGGIPEVIDDGVDGLIVEAGDMGALCRAVETLVVDGNRYMAISRKAQNKVLRDFDRSSWARRIERCYLSMLNKREEASNG
jgi:glycosyltransferase involved in cell wall biosynthesis